MSGSPSPTETPSSTRSSNRIVFRPGSHSHNTPNPTYHVCHTPSWTNNLLPYVRKQIGSQATTASAPRNAKIQQFVLSWFVRYKFKISIVSLVEKSGCIVIQPADDIPVRTKIAIIVRDADVALLGDSKATATEEEHDHDAIRNFTAPTVLIECHQPTSQQSYSIVRNHGYSSLLNYVEANDNLNSSQWKRQVLICTWMSGFGRTICYEYDAKPLSLFTAIQLLEVVIHLDCVKVSPEITQPKPTSSFVAQKRLRRTKCTRQTRSMCNKISMLLSSSSRSKDAIHYISSAARRHLIGEFPKLTKLPALMDMDGAKSWSGLIDESLIGKRIQTISELEGLHSALIHLNILAPRDEWEDWINNFKGEAGCDAAFMCLLIIIMSSSTSDNQLAHIVPRLFSSGLTSAPAVIDIAQRYGLDMFCSLFSESGRYYQNAERILNAADYFVQRHNGRIPNNINVGELSTLLGVGYKTANIVITTAFRRVEGIPSDIHVIRWSSMMGWCPSNSDGLKCSKMLEEWLPKCKWESINPLFGAFGQLLVSEKRCDLLSLSQQHPSPYIRKLFRKAASTVYKK
jgi:endonuclease III